MPHATSNPQSMASTLHSSLDTLDSALDTLITSISTLNPSPASAHSLLIADDALSTSLQTLSTHQHNFTLLTHLHSISAAKDARLKAHLTHLASTRARLLASASASALSNTPETSDHASLLAYAAHIAKTTAPASIPLTAPPPRVLDSAAPATPYAQHATGESAAEEARQNAALARLDPGLKAWLEPASGFAPWPSEEMIRRGALARTGGMQPSVGVAAAVQEERNLGLANVDGDDVEMPRPVAVAGRSDTAAAPARKTEDIDLEGFDLYDPDEEDED